MRSQAAGKRGLMDDIRRIINAIQGLPRLMLNQGAADTPIMEFKSSDVAHGGYQSDVDTFGTVIKSEGAAGGLELNGYKSDAGQPAIALNLRGFLDENALTSKSTATRGIVEIAAYQTSGGAIANTVADGNLCVWYTYRGGAFVSVAIIDEDGDLHLDGVVAAYDDEDDALMAMDLAHVMSGDYEKLIEYNRPAFEAAGIIGPQDENGHFMISSKKTTALTLGALGQLHGRMQAQDKRIAQLERALLEVGNG